MCFVFFALAVGAFSGNGDERWGSHRGNEIVLSDGVRIPEAEALYLAPASPSKILAVHLTYGSRVREYDARMPPELRRRLLRTRS